MELVKRRQEMPPPGGYKPVTFHRIPPRQFFNGWTLIGLYLGMTAVSGYLYYLTYYRIRRREVEERSANFAVLPLILAERDREYLKQLRRNRDEERELMKDVEGWKVGTFYGEPIFKLAPEDTLIEPVMPEFYVHASYRDFSKRFNLQNMS